MFGFAFSHLAHRSCASGAALAGLITVQTGRETSERVEQAIWQTHQLPLLLLLLRLLQLRQHLGMLHIGDPYVDRLVVVAVAAAAVDVLVVGEARRRQLDNRWRHRQRCRGLYVGVVRRRRVRVAGLDAQLLLVVVLLEIALETPGQLQLVDAVVGGIRDDGGTRQLLQRERLAAVQRHGQAGLKEHDARRVLVVLQQAGHR